MKESVMGNVTIRLETENDYREVEELTREAFDKTFPPKGKAWAPSQEEFYIYSRSSVVR